MCRMTELIDTLSDEERASLREIASGPARRRIPHVHAEKFLSLGLAELVFGYQELTVQGKRAVAMMQR